MSFGWVFNPITKRFSGESLGLRKGESLGLFLPVSLTKLPCGFHVDAMWTSRRVCLALAEQSFT